MPSKRQRLKEWAAALTPEQAQKALVDMTEYAITSEWISFYKDTQYPYYSTCGEPLVDGQENPYDDDE